MEVVLDTKDPSLVLRNTLGLVRPLASDLDGSLDSFGASAHGEHHVVAKDVADLLSPLGEDIVVESSRAQGQAAGLLRQSLDELGVAVALVDGAVGGKEVEVLVALGVPDVDALGAGENDGQRVVVVGGILLLDGNGFLGGSRVESRLDAVGDVSVGGHCGGYCFGFFGVLVAG